MYRVTAPYVTVRITAPTGGETVHGFYDGAILPDTAIQESIDALLAKGMVEKLPATEAKKIEKAEVEAEKAAADAVAKPAESEPATKVAKA